MSINLFLEFVDEGRARHHLVISCKNYERRTNILYYKQHYTQITSSFGCL